MGKPVVHLFCDTNLLFQCKVLEELDWSAWQSFDVRVVVTKPVLREVDYRKTQGNSRLARRARAANTLFRKMRAAGEKVVREAKPRVTLHVEPQHGYSAELADTLNYEERDEQTKKVNELQEEVARLRRAEPSFDIRFLDTVGNEAERFEMDLDLYEPLSEAEVGALMERLRRLHPVKTEFGPPKAKRASGSQLSQAIELAGLATGRVYDAPSEEKVASYRDEAYPDWLSKCERMLSVVHHLLQQRGPIVRFCFSARNGGTRPAASALVTIEAHGGFRIMAARDSEASEPIRLPAPPRPPRGRWRNPFNFDHDLTAWMNPGRFAGESLVDALRPAPARDPNRFYHKSDDPLAPAESFSLDCEQWRHAEGRKEFCGEISVPPGSGEVCGALKLRIQAENLSEPAVRTVPVRIRTRNVGSHAFAAALVERVGEKKTS